MIIIPRKKMLKNKPGFDEYLKTAYIDQEKTMAEIAEKVGCTPSTILYHLRRCEIKTRTGYTGEFEMTEEHKRIISETHKGKTVSQETRDKMSKAAKGRKSPNWNGGKRNRSDGYIQLFRPEHPNSCAEGYVMEHRLVMENKLGLLLKPEEVVHHINGIRDDNRPENLKLFSSKSDHIKFHHKNGDYRKDDKNE